MGKRELGLYDEYIHTVQEAERFRRTLPNRKQENWGSHQYSVEHGIPGVAPADTTILAPPGLRK